jgi:hypothetical protein
MNSRLEMKTPSDNSIKYWYTEGLKYLKKMPLTSEKQLEKFAEDFSIYAIREYYGYRGVIPKTKLEATKKVMLEKFQKSSIVKNQLGLKKKK